MSTADEIRQHQRAMERHAGATNSELRKLGKTFDEVKGVQSRIAAGQDKIAQLSQQQVQLQQAMLDVQRRQLAVQEQTLVVTQLQLEQSQIQTALQQLSMLQRQRQRELKEAAFSIRKRLDSLKSHDDPLRSWVVLALEMRDADSAGLEASELEEIADKEYVQEVRRELNAATEESRARMSEGDISLIEALLSYAELSSLRDSLRTELAGLKSQLPRKAAKISHNSTLLAFGMAALGCIAFLVGVKGDVTLLLGGLLIACLGLGVGMLLLLDSGKAASVERKRSTIAARISPLVAAAERNLGDVEARLAPLVTQVDECRPRVPELQRW
jgi:hypothetical protein